MEEAVRRKKYTHFILMDDDVVIEYNALQKVTGFLRFLKDFWIWVTRNRRAITLTMSANTLRFLEILTVLRYS